MNNLPSLSELCYEKIATTIYNAPPLLQEMIIGKTTEKVEKQITNKIKKKVVRKHKKQIKTRISKDLTDILPHIIPDICSEIINSLKSSYPPPNFYEKYNSIPKHIVKCAIESAENIVRTLEERYVYTDYSNISEYDSDY